MQKIISNQAIYILLVVEFTIVKNSCGDEGCAKVVTLN